MGSEFTVRLSTLIEKTTAVTVRARLNGHGDPAIGALAFDSRAVEPASLFFCLPGERRDGHDFADAAIAAGAVALVVDRPLDVDLAVTQVVVDNVRAAMGPVAAEYFHHPSRSMTTIGVTGTNGKTTTTHILACALEHLGRRTGVIGTLSGAHTTPEAPELQRRLAEFRADGCAAIAMEVSSHGLALDRVAGTSFDVGVFTNLGHDHLDLHGTQERYFAAKARLFEPARTAHGVVNIDDVHGRLLLDASTIPMTAFGFGDAVEPVIAAFHHEYMWRGERVRVGLGGRFNVMNSLAAATTLAVVGFPPDEISAGLAATTPVPGRFQPVDGGQDFAVVVDYAHTPDALEQVLVAARGVSGGNRVIVVFGCGGDRDHDKRPAMGLVASTRADRVIVTSDNPRSEEPLAIIDDVVAGVPRDYRDRVAIEPDRLGAIAMALRAAGHGDVVVIAGKGHETTQTFRSSVAPFDDRQVARTLLESML